MSQKTVEHIIGRLATDEEIRHRFRKDPVATIAAAAGEPESLTAVEREALSSIDPDVLDRLADAIDPRLQRVNIPAASDSARRR
ncbi:MAG: Os1348 family NHLP clan protein [Thermoanaerobaculia bacterium]